MHHLYSLAVHETALNIFFTHNVVATEHKIILKTVNSVFLCFAILNKVKSFIFKKRKFENKNNNK